MKKDIPDSNLQVLPWLVLDETWPAHQLSSLRQCHLLLSQSLTTTLVQIMHHVVILARYRTTYPYDLQMACQYLTWIGRKSDDKWKYLI